jgi:sulfide:quinone oxidoreductase
MAPGGERPSLGPTMSRIVIAGGGIAGLEALVALRRQLGPAPAIDLIETNVELVERPMSVAEPFGPVAARHFDLARIAADQGATLRRDRLASVDPAARALRTVGGDVLQYDALLVAVGARADVAIPGALTFSGPRAVGALRDLLGDLVARRVRAVAFAVPRGVTWPLPLYELALMTAEHVRARGVDDVRLVLVTPERNPLDLFGVPIAARIRALLAERGIGLFTDTVPGGLGAGGLATAGGKPLAVERVVALPRLGGPWIDGLPHDDDGFIPTDRHGAVPGAPGVWAAGDGTTFPIKQGGLAAQQADAAAAAMAAHLGADVVPAPFRPELRGLLLDPRGARFLERDPGEPSNATMWWPPSKVATQHLAPYLAAAMGAGEHVHDENEIDVAGLLLALANNHAAAGDTALAVRCLDAAEQLRGDLPADAAAQRRELTGALR